MAQFRFIVFFLNRKFGSINGRIGSWRQVHLAGTLLSQIKITSVLVQLSDLDVPGNGIHVSHIWLSRQKATISKTSLILCGYWRMINPLLSR